jgi:hypothetical protein
MLSDKVSREEHKTIYNGLRISGMTLSNQSDLPAFFSPRIVSLKIGPIPEDDISRIAKYRKTTFQEWPPVYHSGSNEPSLAPQLKWPDNTFKVAVVFRLQTFHTN